MKLIGLTGGIGTGKSTVSEYLIKSGYIVLDADKISREIVEPNSKTLQELCEIFGYGILLDDGSLNRKKLADLVFTEPEKKRVLDEIMHSKVIDILISRAKSFTDEKVVFLDVPLLFETEMDKLLDEVWVVDADEETRIKRVMDRDKLTREEIQYRIDHQMKRDEKLEKADQIIDNSDDKCKLYSRIQKLLNEI